ncbi:hypothetical protein GCM10011516_13620 [Sphingobacterium cellulitidis]|uniref:DUF5000 domain-containing protein n=2 Tax=Sphingobacterium cellulitidis TaxID=1768011 RepID=A0A8H9FZA2_9SPHI|nr:hypothetical protein GCM10011516_13620 [Sphingobacterium soli]
MRLNSLSGVILNNLNEINMLKKYIYFAAGIILLAIFSQSCRKWDDYKKYIEDGEKIYPSKASDIKAHPGNGRVLLAWKKELDESVTKFRVFWNNGNDSSEVDASKFKIGDTVKHYIDKLKESSYTFTIYSYDANGNRSVATEIPPVNIYGSKYQAALLNRPVKKVDYLADKSQLTIEWGTPDTIYMHTEIKYVDSQNKARVLVIGPEDVTTDLSWKLGTKVYYKSTYLPITGAIDSFQNVNQDSILVQNIMVPKEKWVKINLPNDIPADGYGTKLSNIWDGQLGSFPNIYHSEGGSIPHHFTIDLGESRQLTMFEESGRQDCACHNPIEFEIWGLNDVKNASTALPATDPKWSTESTSKGWKLLKTVKRTDNGIAPLKMELDEGIPAVRYIRIRVLKTQDNSIESHMGEISFWYNP